MIKLLASALICLTVTSCATNYAKKPPSEVAKAITIKNSEFDGSITYIGPQTRSETSRGLFVDNQTAILVATQDKKTNSMSYYVYVRILYSFDWRFYHSVSFNDGSITPTKEISRQVNSCTGIGCIHTEEFSFPVEFTRLSKQSDLTFRANSKKGAENIITLNKSYVDGFIQGLQNKISGG